MNGADVFADLLRVLEPPIVVIWVTEAVPEKYKERVFSMPLAPSTVRLYADYGIKAADKMLIVRPDNVHRLFRQLEQNNVPYTTKRPWLDRGDGEHQQEAL